ncbi:MAG: MATE family efflux transporter [Clostridia bacterium]|nr:MATE family efflux transporter [Clostridia bacterium]
MNDFQATETSLEQGNRYLGEEKISRLMLKFSVPCVLSLVVSALYNIIDQIFIGNSELGTLGNGATGVVFPLFVIAQAFAWWFGDGCAAYLNICQGEKSSQNAHRAIGTGIVLTLAASLVLIAVFFPLKYPLLTLFGARENNMELAVQYCDIILAFFPVMMLMNMLSSVVRADGSPGWAMASMLAGAAVNIVLDAVFILVLKWGMAGAAWATVIGQITSLAVSVFYLWRKTKTFKLGLKSFVPDFKEFSGAAKLGISSFITQATIVIVATVGNNALAQYGEQSVYGAYSPIAIMGVENKVYALVINLVVGICLGCQPIISYNVGAKNTKRVKKLYLSILLCTLIIGVVATLVFEIFPTQVAGLFGEPSGEGVDPVTYWQFAEKTFRIYLMLVIFTLFVKMTSIFFMAAGKPVFATVVSLIRDLICLIPLICVLPIYLGVEGVLWAAPVADGVSAVVTVILTVIWFKSLDK